MKHLRFVLFFALFALVASAQQRAITKAEITAGTFSVTIAEGGTTSEAVGVGRHCVAIGLYLPSALTSTAIAIHGAISNETPRAITDQYGTALSVTVAADKYVTLDPAQLLGVRVIQLVAGSAEAAARTIKVVCR